MSVTKPKRGPGRPPRNPVMAAAADIAKSAAAMARSVAQAGDESGSELGEDAEQELLNSEDAIAEALNSETTQAQALVFRKNPDTGRWDNLDEIGPLEVTAANFRDWYGGGTFKVLYRVPSRHPGKMAFRKGTKVIDIDRSIPATPPPRFRGQAKNGTAVAELGTKPAAGGVLGDLELFSGLMKVNLTMMQAVSVALANVGKPDPIVGEILKAALLKKDPAPAAGPSLRDQLETMQLLDEMAERRGGGGERGPVPAGHGRTAWDVGHEAIEMFGKFIDRAGGALTPAPPVTRLASSAPAPVPDAPAAPPASVDPMDQMGMMLGKYLPRLLDKAAQDKDPYLWAGVLVEEIPPGFYGQMVTFLEQPGLIDELIRRAPPVAPHREWFADFLGAMVERLKDELAPDEDAPAGEAPAVE